jgi:DNA-binding LacI/PurR family transcriptional regulator
MPPTIKDIADKLGVSTATVSRALRGLPNVAPSTRARVLQIAKDLNYSIDPRASSLASGRTMNIGIVMPLVDTWFYSKLATAAEAMLIDSEYYVTRYNVDSLSDQTAHFRRLSNGRHVDGLIVATAALGKEDIDILHNLKVPVVTVETSTKDFASISVDNALAAQIATRYLINLGHKRIGLITGLQDDPMHFSVPQERLLGYHTALEEYELEVRPELEVSGNFSLAGGAEAMIELLSVRYPPTAVFALSDEMAIGALKSIREMNLRVPEDISVLGFDDHDIAEYIGLTTVRQPVVDYGEKAISMLLNLLENPENGTHPHVKLDTQLIVRSTTGPPMR